MSATILESPDPVAAVANSCRHCGASLIDDRMRSSGFCCAGCTYVYRLVHEHGLAGYYKIKDEITAPADAAVFQARDYAWLEAAQREAEASTPASDEPTHRAATTVGGKVGIPELTLDVQGISCAGCVWLIERVFQQLPGARHINVNAQYGSMRLRWVRGEFSAADFARKLQAFGYLAGVAGEAPAEPESRGLVKRIGLCAAFAMNVMLFSLPVYFGMEKTFEWAGLFGLLSLGFGTLSFLVGGLYFLSRALNALRERAMHIDLPIAIGIVGAYVGSLYGWIAGEEKFVYFDFVSTFILLMLVGRWAQVAAVERNRRRLLSQQPKPQRVRLADGTQLTPEQLKAGQVLMLAVGQTLPVESRLEATDATFSLASINGEAEPHIYRVHQRVPAGAVNIGRTDLRLATLQAWNESLLAQLLQPGERAGERHGFLERIVRGYLLGILVVAAASGLGWWIVTADALRTWSVVTAVLVVSCPCAVALAFPLADEMATVALRRRGVFVREGDLWTKLARVRKLVFDKTGTLTLETPVLQNPGAIDALAPVAREALLTLVRDNPHPISQCLLENLLARPATAAGAVGAIQSTGCDVPTEATVQETVGCGVEWNGWTLGRAGWRDGNEGEDTVFACAGDVVAVFRFADTVRSDARSELDALREDGYAAFILSGDRKEKVATLAAELGLRPEDAVGQLSPQEKASWLETHGADDAMMLGDGANDSLAFDQALCRGTPVIHRGVLERKADFYYLGRGIGGLRALFAVDAIRRRTQMTVLIFSIGYNALAVGLAVAGRMNPLVAAALMPINSLLTLALVTTGMRRAFRARESAA
ncbi:MAG: heavy metal translocating P-type ATPase metal-binding domain-containing protein [Opitutus sp.]